MTKRFATVAAILALSAATVTAQAASRNDPAQDQRENAITAQLNQRQLQGSGMSNRGMMQEQTAQPPTGSSDLSIIE